jgi:hypothetical protein
VVPVSVCVCVRARARERERERERESVGRSRYIAKRSYCHMIDNTQGFGLVIGFIGFFDTVQDYTLHFTITHIAVSKVMSSLYDQPFTG